MSTPVVGSLATVPLRAAVRGLLAVLVAGVGFMSPALADMYPDASNAKLPDARANLHIPAHLPTNAALTAASTAMYSSGVWRDTFGNGNGASPLYYLPSGSACSLKSGAGDNGAQVKSSDGKCWVAMFPSRGIDPRQWGAKGDAATDSTVAINAAINYLVDVNLGGTVHLVAAPNYYLVSGAGIVIDTTAHSSSTLDGRIHLVGDGPSRSVIYCPTCTGDAISYTGSNGLGQQSFFAIRDLSILGANNNISNVGLAITKGAFCQISDVVISGFVIGLDAGDTDQCGVYDSFFQFNTNGVLLGSAVTTTGPNNWSFFNTVISSNTLSGLTNTNTNGLNFSGGSIQYNGTQKTANGTISTGAPTITMSTNGVGYISSGSPVWDLTTGKLLGLFSTWPTNSTTLTMQGNSAFNGSGSSDVIAFGYGASISNANTGNGAGLGYATAKFVGMIFEGNMGAGDLFISQATAGSQLNVSIDNVAFTRTVNYGVNDIMVAGSTAVNLSVNSSVFGSSTAYTATSVRPTIASNNAALITKISDRDNIFHSASEVPAASIFSTITRPTVWTPTDQSGAGLTFSCVADCVYTKRDGLYSVKFAFTWPATADATNIAIGGLPDKALNLGSSDVALMSDSTTGITYSTLILPNSTTFEPINILAPGLVHNSVFSGHAIGGSMTYMGQ